MQLTAQLRKEYESLFSGMKINPADEASVKWIVDRIVKAKSRYEPVAKLTGVPWYVIAVIHNMESSGSFSGVLHNGEHIIGTGKKTTLVPAGRGPFATWEEAALDALKYDGSASYKDWTLAGICYFLEGYNGWGYRTGAGKKTTPPMRSPYLWSFSNQYTTGKYASDGYFDPRLTSAQCGAAVILWYMEKNKIIDIPDFAFAEVKPTPVVTALIDLPDLPANMILKLGDTNEYVKMAQAALNKLGFGPLDEDGEFGEITEGAVVAFQKAAKIQTTAKIGPTTWGGLETYGKPQPSPVKPDDVKTGLNKIVLAEGTALKLGDKSDNVRVVRSALSLLGYTIATDSDEFSETLVTVLKKFQAEHSVGQTGQLGNQTLSALKAALADKSGSSTQSVTNQKLFNFYSKESGYHKVEAWVKSFYAPFRSNGCVAFMSSALYGIGIDVPMGETSLVTRPFSDWLMKQGWVKITDHTKLLPGDIVFTEDHSSYPGYPAHTYLFAGWYGSGKRNGYVIDNQAFTHVRNVFGYGDYNFTPFQYALRAKA